MPKKKRPLLWGEKFDADIHVDRRIGGERRKPWKRVDPSDRRSGLDRRKRPEGVRAAHVFEVVPGEKKAKKKG